MKRLSAECDRGAFSCGNAHIDHFFQAQAGDHHSKLTCRVVAAFVDGGLAPVGFYSLCVTSEPADEFAADFRERFVLKVRGHSIIIADLQWVAVANPWQHRGIGTLLLGRAIDDFFEIADRGGVAAMTLKPVDHQVASFYEKLGFTHYGSLDPARMFLPGDAVIEAKIAEAEA